MDSDGFWFIFPNEIAILGSLPYFQRYPFPEVISYETLLNKCTTHHGFLNIYLSKIAL